MDGGVMARYRALPLRVGLVAAMLVLAACGLLASGVAVTSILRHTLIGRLDESLIDASRPGPGTPPGTPVGCRAEPVPPAVELLCAGRRRERGRVDGHQRPAGPAGPAGQQ